MAKIQNISENRIANNMTSSELIHPGEMIKDEIMARGLTQKELAQQMGVSQADYNMQKIKQDKSFMKKLEKIRKIAAIF